MLATQNSKYAGKGTAKHQKQPAGSGSERVADAADDFMNFGKRGICSVFGQFETKLLDEQMLFHHSFLTFALVREGLVNIHMYKRYG